jgi:hypothetical protein
MPGSQSGKRFAMVCGGLLLPIINRALAASASSLHRLNSVFTSVSHFPDSSRVSK